MENGRRKGKVTENNENRRQRSTSSGTRQAEYVVMSSAFCLLFSQGAKKVSVPAGRKGGK